MNSTFISAGQVLNLTSQNGIYADLARIIEGQNIRCGSQDVGVSPAGLSLTLDIPGDQCGLICWSVLSTGRVKPHSIEYDAKDKS